MPTSFPNQIFTIISIIIKINPDKLLDIGCGAGKYGVLAREYLENWFGTEKLYQFKHQIDCIEIFEKYITELHRFIYDNIYIGNALDIVNKLNKQYDLTLLIDVLEHFNKEDGEKLITEIKKISKNIIVSTPVYFINQGTIYENEYETHKSLWQKKDFLKIDNKNSYFFHIDENLIWFNGKDSKKLKLFHKKYLIKKYVPIIPEIYKKIKFLYYRSKMSLSP